jgi:hypothetical protein
MKRKLKNGAGTLNSKCLASRDDSLGKKGGYRAIVGGPRE